MRISRFDNAVEKWPLRITHFAMHAHAYEGEAGVRESRVRLSPEEARAAGIRREEKHAS